MATGWARSIIAAAAWIAAFALSPLDAAPRTLPVPAVTIYPGDVISSDRLSERRFASTQAAASVFETREAVVGKVARRTLLPGKPIAINAVRDPHAVSLGGTILAVYQVGALTITSRVQPLRAGSVGELIEARNIDSGKIITGTVQADGSMRVSAP